MKFRIETMEEIYMAHAIEFDEAMPPYLRVRGEHNSYPGFLLSPEDVLSIRLVP